MSASKLDLSARSLSFLSPLSRFERVADGHSPLASAGTRRPLIFNPAPPQNSHSHIARIETLPVWAKYYIATACKPCAMWWRRSSRRYICRPRIARGRARAPAL